MKIKKLTLASLALASILTLTACGEKKEEQSVVTPEQSPTETTEETETTLRFGVMGSLDTVPLVIAAQNGYFEEEGVNLDLQIFSAAKDRDAALQAGELDGVLCDEVAISIYQNSDINMQITGTTNGVYTLVAAKDSGITSLADLAGKKMAISENTMMDYLADYIAIENGMSANDIEKVAIPAMPARLEALNNNRVDAAILPTPFNDTAIADGGVEIEKLYNKDIMISVTAFLQEVIEQNPEAVQGFYRAYNKAIDFINSTDMSEYEDIIITTVGYAEEMRGKIVLPEFQHNYLPNEENVQRVFDWSKDKGLLTKDIQASDVINNIAFE